MVGHGSIDADDLIGDAAVITGAVIPYTGSDEPDGYLRADGQAVSRTGEADLFAVHGTRYGAGNGSTTFNVVDLRDRFIYGGVPNDRGDDGGAETVTLTTAQMPAHAHDGPAHRHTGPSHTHTTPSHTHTLAAHTHTVSDLHALSSATILQGTGTTISVREGFTTTTRTTSGAGGGTTGSRSAGATGSSGTAETGEAGDDPTSSVGGGQAHNNMPPYMVLVYLVKT